MGTITCICNDSDLNYEKNNELEFRNKKLSNYF